MPYRILCITPWFPNDPNGQFGNFILHSVEALVRGGNRVTVLVTRPWTPWIFGLLHPDWVRPPLQMDKFDPSLNLRVAHYPSFPRNFFCASAGNLYRLGTAGIIRRLIRDFAPDLIHVHTELPAFGAVAAGREANLPVIATLHGINTAPRLLNTVRKREILRNTLDGADRVVLVGEPLRPYFAPLAGRDDHFRVVPNGFHLPFPPDAPGSERAGSTLRIISVSNLHEGKGIDLSIDALALLDKSGVTDWSYVIVGGGRERGQLEARVNAHGLGDRISFRGPLSHDRAMALLREADLFLLPSYREAFGVAYLEAMAVGLLAIGVRGEGPEAFIRHGETGYLLPPRDVEAICSLLRSVVGNRKAAEGIAAAGREHVRRELTWDRHAEKLTAVYGEVAGGAA